MAEAVQSTVDRVQTRDGVPRAIAEYLRAHNLPQTVRRGDDERLATLPWQRQKTLAVSTGPSAGDDPVGLGHAYAGVAETGTLILLSGADNPSTLSFLPEPISSWSRPAISRAITKPSGRGCARMPARGGCRARST